MTPGGSDIIIECPPGVDVVGLFLARVRLQWPDAWAAAGDDDPRPIREARVPAGTREVFAYRDRAAVASWDRDGATEANMDAMLYLIAPPAPAGALRPVTLVVGRRTAAVEQLVRDLDRTSRAMWRG